MASDDIASATVSPPGREERVAHIVNALEGVSTAQALEIRGDAIQHTQALGNHEKATLRRRIADMQSARADIGLARL